MGINMAERIFAIGDIHGCRARLESLLKILDADINKKEDMVVFIGDYIDRGPDSKGTVETIVRFAEQFPQTVLLRGNHEQMLLDYLRGDDQLLYLMNGGGRTLEEYGVSKGREGLENIPERHLLFYENLLYSFETEEYIFVHAGLRPNIPLKRQSQQDLLWIRERFIYSSASFDKTVVFGHTPFAEPLLEADKIGIDTGAVYGGKLTCIELPSRKLIQI